MQAWIQTDSVDNAFKITQHLSDAVKANTGFEFKAFVICMPTATQTGKAFAETLQKLAAEKGIENVGIAYVERGNEAIGIYKMNTASEMKNTVIVYKNKRVTSKFVNLLFTDEGRKALSDAIAGVCN